jgi:hypothetical protein
MPSFRNPMTFAAAAALAAAIGAVGTPEHAHLTSNAVAHNALAALGSASADLNGVAVKVVSGLEAVPRASTYADEVANTNHEGF